MLFKEKIIIIKMQLTKIENLSKENLIFHEAKEYSVNNS